MKSSLQQNIIEVWRRINNFTGYKKEQPGTSGPVGEGDPSSP